MINENNILILEEAKRAILSNFFIMGICEELKQFIEYKMQLGFPFGNLVLLHYRMFKGQNEDIHKIAAAIEVTILSLDILDDLQDQDDDCVPWMQIDPAISMNLATVLILLSTKLVEESNFPIDTKMQVIGCLKLSYNKENRKDLWKTSVELSALKGNETIFPLDTPITYGNYGNSSLIIE
ncbi:MAG: hypothetical protein WDZ91_14155 [Paenibacillaceae bacterium]